MEGSLSLLSSYVFLDVCACAASIVSIDFVSVVHEENVVCSNQSYFSSFLVNGGYVEVLHDSTEKQKSSWIQLGYTQLRRVLCVVSLIRICNITFIYTALKLFWMVNQACSSFPIQRIICVGLCEKVLQGAGYLGQINTRSPVFSKDIKANASLIVDVWMKYLSISPFQ